MSQVVSIWSQVLPASSLPAPSASLQSGIDSDNVVSVVFPFSTSVIGAMETIRVRWKLNGVVDSNLFPADSLWADVRNYIWNIWDISFRCGQAVPAVPLEIFRVRIIGARLTVGLLFRAHFFLLFDPQLRLPVDGGDGSEVQYGQEVDYFEEIRKSTPTSKEAPLLVEIKQVPYFAPSFGQIYDNRYHCAHYFPLENVCSIIFLTGSNTTDRYEFEPLDVPEGDNLNALSDLLSIPIRNKVKVPPAIAAIFWELLGVRATTLPDWMELDPSSTRHYYLWHNITRVLLHERAAGGAAGIHARVDAALSVNNCNRTMQLTRDDKTDSFPDAWLVIDGYPPLVIVEEANATFLANPTYKLQKKFRRFPDYTGLPFVIGIAIEDDYVTIHRMSLDNDSKTQEGLLSEFPAGRLNLRISQERIRFIQVLINLGRYCDAVYQNPRRYIMFSGHRFFAPNY